MTGTIINTITILFGGLVGLVLKKGMQSSVQESIMKVQGVVIFLIGLNGVLGAMITVDANGKLQSEGIMLLFASLVIGTIVGELLRIEERVNNIGERIETKFGLSGVTKGFIDCSLLFCIGAMSILGSINEGLYGDPSILLVKSALDGVCAVLFASSLGIGVAFSSISVLIYQGAITLGASALSSFVSEALLNSFSMVGYSILMCLGLNFVANTKIRTTNTIPALIIPIIYALVV